MNGAWLRTRRAYLFIFFCYAIGLWAFSVPLTGDQKTYLTIALEMRERGAWVIPTLFGEPNFLKPPLQYWATLLGWSVFGFGTWGALLPSVFALLGAAGFVRLTSDAEDHVPALLFASTLATMTYGTTAQMEIWVVLFYLGAWWLWWRERTFLAFLVVGVMSWIKGPLYPVLWVLSVLFEAWRTRRFRERVWNRTFLWTCSVGILIGLLWYLVAARTHAQEMMAGFFLKENIGKIQTAHGTPLGLWGEFLGTLFPVLILFGVLLPSREFLAAWKRNRHRWLGYTLIPALFFTLFPYRVNTYLYLLTPAVIWVIMSSRGALERRARVAGTLAALASGLLLFLIWRLFAGGWIAPGLCLSFGAILPCWAWAHFRASLSGVAMTSLVLVTLIRLSAVGIGEFDLAGLREFMQERQTSYAFWMEQEDIWHEVGLISSATGKRISILKNGEEVRKHLLAGGAVLLEDSQKSPLSGVSCRDWFRLKKRIKFPVRELLTRGLSIRDGALHRAYQICWK